MRRKLTRIWILVMCAFLVLIHGLLFFYDADEPLKPLGYFEKTIPRASGERSNDNKLIGVIVQVPDRHFIPTDAEYERIVKYTNEQWAADRQRGFMLDPPTLWRFQVRQFEARKALIHFSDNSFANGSVLAKLSPTEAGFRMDENFHAWRITFGTSSTAEFPPWTWYRFYFAKSLLPTSTIAVGVKVPTDDKKTPANIYYSKRFLTKEEAFSPGTKADQNYPVPAKAIQLDDRKAPY